MCIDDDDVIVYTVAILRLVYENAHTLESGEWWSDVQNGVNDEK